jgi:dTMP kinase
MSQNSPNNAAPMFIVLEGIDGSGTTTQLNRLAERLRPQGRSVVATREPSPGPIGLLLRDLLRGTHANPDGSSLDERAMALLFAADRRDHLTREIEPALAGGFDVVSDRYLPSSLAYQAVAADRAWVEQLANGVREPDLTLLLDVEIGVAARRRHHPPRKSGPGSSRIGEGSWESRLAPFHAQRCFFTSAGRFFDTTWWRGAGGALGTAAGAASASFSSPACAFTGGVSTFGASTGGADGTGFSTGGGDGAIGAMAAWAGSASWWPLPRT